MCRLHASAGCFRTPLGLSIPIMQDPTNMLVRVQNLSKEYRRGQTLVSALQDVTLDVKAGEFCAFVGPSGCGKSTLLNLIGGLDQPTAGIIAIENRPVTHASATEWTRLRRELIGIVFQAFHLIPGLTVAENVALPLLLKGSGGLRWPSGSTKSWKRCGWTGDVRTGPASCREGNSSVSRLPGRSCIGHDLYWRMNRPGISIPSKGRTSSACSVRYRNGLVTRCCW